MLSACANKRARTRAPLLERAREIPAHDLAVLSVQDLAPDPTRDVAQELGALHLLCDLLDHARFAQSAASRDLLWKVLESGQSRRGPQAFRDAASAILQRAWALESRIQQTPGLPQWTKAMDESLPQLIMLLSMDVNPSAGPEQLTSLALGLRTLRSEAHPEIEDNLHWRYYDLERALMQAIVNAPFADRPSLLRYGGLLVDDPNEDYPGHSTLAHWSAPWQRAREALRNDPRWSNTLRTRDAQDDALLARMKVILPVQRASDWSLPAMADKPDAEPFAVDSMGTLIRMGDTFLRADDLSLPLQKLPRMQKAIAEHLALVGRTSAVAAIDRMTPAPLLHRAMQAMSEAGLRDLLLAGYPQDAKPAPLGHHASLIGVPITLSPELSPKALYIAGFSTGYRVGWDDAMMPELLADLDALAMWVDRYRFAYPTATTLQVAFAQDLAYEQRLAVITRLHQDFGQNSTIVWVTQASEVPELWPDSPALLAQLDARARWRWGRGQSVPTIRLDTVAGQEPGTDDVAAAHALAQSLQPCFTELERTKLRKAAVTATLRFVEGSLAAWEWTGPAASRIDATATARFNGCVQALASNQRLPSARAPWQVRVQWTLPSSAI